MAKTLNVKTFLTKKFDILPFEGVWQKSFGNPCRQDSIMIYGSSGSGKTELAMMLGKYLTNFGRVAYNSIEQKDSHTLQMAVKRNHLDTVSDKFQIIPGERLPELAERLRKQRSPDFIIIDSIQYLDATKDEYFEFKDEFYSKKGCIWISQVNGKPKLENLDDKIKGALANNIWYDVDIQVPVVGFQGFPKKRLNGGEEPFIINHEKAAKHWAKID
ncbi:MAG: ATP-binding protein [Chryseobacterium sp.]